MSLWDADQREWLQAMGYSLLVLAGDEAGEPLAEPSHAVDGGAGPRPGPGHGHGHGGDGRAPDTTRRSPASTGPELPEPARARAAPALPAAPGGAPAPPPRPRTDAAAKAAALEAARAGASGRCEGPLWDALLAATGQPPALAARTLREFGVDLAALRADPAAKRALWIRLRRLRRSATP